jgi:hypothetical protein
VVRIVFADTHHCTAIVLSEHWLLTAGHCVEQALSDDHVEVSQQVYRERTVLYDGDAELVLHPDYDGSAVLTHRWNDVALLGSKIRWLDAATASTAAPLRCADLGDDCWECVE